jgi:hypothetical protein
MMKTRNLAIFLLSVVFLQCTLALDQSPWEGTYYFEVQHSMSVCLSPLFKICPPDRTPFKITRDGNKITLDYQIYNKKATITLPIISENVAEDKVGEITRRVTKGRLGITILEKTKLDVYAFRDPSFNSYEGYWKGTYKAQGCTTQTVCCPVGTVTVTEASKQQLDITGAGNDACPNKIYNLSILSEEPKTFNYAIGGRNVADPNDRAEYNALRLISSIVLTWGNMKITLME